MIANIENVITALHNLRVGIMTDEYDLQAEIAKVLSAADIEYAKEHVLGPRNRVDFLTAAGIAVEVKKGKPNRAKVMEQLWRYAEFPEVTGVILVVETSLRMPIININDKPCRVLGLQKLWGIAI